MALIGAAAVAEIAVDLGLGAAADAGIEVATAAGGTLATNVVAGVGYLLGYAGSNAFYKDEYGKNKTEPMDAAYSFYSSNAVRENFGPRRKPEPKPGDKSVDLPGGRKAVMMCKADTAATVVGSLELGETVLGIFHTTLPCIKRFKISPQTQSGGFFGVLSHIEFNLPVSVDELTEGTIDIDDYRPIWAKTVQTTDPTNLNSWVEEKDFHTSGMLPFGKCYFVAGFSSVPPTSLLKVHVEWEMRTVATLDVIKEMIANGDISRLRQNPLLIFHYGSAYFRARTGG